MTREHKLRQAIIEEIDGYKYNGIGESWTRTDEGIVIQYPSGATTICKDWLVEHGTEDRINFALHFYKLGQQGGLGL